MLSLCYVLLLRKSTKTPGARKFQSTSFLFKSRKRHLSVKEVLPLELPACFLGAAGLLQLATRQSERLTSSQTGLALFPKNNQVQAVEFNGAGFIGITAANRCRFVVTNSSPVGEVPKAEGYKCYL